MPTFQFFLGLRAREQKQILASLLVQEDIRKIFTPLDRKIEDIRIKKDAHAYLDNLNQRLDEPFFALFDPYAPQKQINFLTRAFNLGLAFFEKSVPHIQTRHYQQIAGALKNIPEEMKENIIDFLHKQISVSSWNALSGLDPFLLLPKKEAVKILERKTESGIVFPLSFTPRTRHVTALRSFIKDHANLFPFEKGPALVFADNILALSEKHMLILENPFLPTKKRKEHLRSFLGDLHDALNEDKELSCEMFMLFGNKEFIEKLSKKYVFGAPQDRLESSLKGLFNRLHRRAKAFQEKAPLMWRFAKTVHEPSRPNTGGPTATQSPGNGS